MKNQKNNSTHSSKDDEKTIIDVGLSFDGKKIFFMFKNGEGYIIPRHKLPGDDGSPLTRIEIFDHGCAVLIHPSSGQAYDLPWDSIKYYARGNKRTPPSQLGAVIKAGRRARHWSQLKLSQLIGLSRVHLSRLENDSVTPSLDTLVKISEVFHIPTAELLQSR